MRENPKPLEQVLTLPRPPNAGGWDIQPLERQPNIIGSPGEIRKSGGTWLVTEKSYEKVIWRAERAKDL